MKYGTGGVKYKKRRVVQEKEKLNTGKREVEHRRMSVVHKMNKRVPE
jgi:hypothetical protein